MINQPPICNAFVERGCEPFNRCGYPVNDLSGVNKKELVNILCYFQERYKSQKASNGAAAHFRRKVHAMQKVLKHFRLHEDEPTRESVTSVNKD